MSGIKDNKRELSQEELSMVSAGAGAENQQEDPKSLPIDPVGPIPNPATNNREIWASSPKYKCSNCQYEIDSIRMGSSFEKCPSCKKPANWILVVQFS